MIIAVDLGTTGVRIAAVDSTLRERHVTRRAIELQSPDEWRRVCHLPSVVDAFVDGVQEVVSSLPHGEPMDAISFASQGEVLFTVDDDGRAPEFFAVTMDNTGTGAANEWIRDRGPEAFHRITGQPCHPMYPIFRLRSERDDEGARSRLVTLDGYLREMVGGTHSTDLSLACRSGLFDAERCIWSDELLQFARLRHARLPVVLPAGSLAGEVSRSGSSLTGLPPGTPIVVGSHDQASVFWGAGGTLDGRPVFSAGSSECLTQASVGRPSVPGVSLPSYPVAGDIWLTLTGTPSGGWSLEWLARFSGHRSVAELVEEACALPESHTLAYPYFAGGPTLRNDPTATASLQRLNLSTTPADVARAMIESSGFELYDALMRTQIAFGPTSVIATAGLGASPAATKVRADVTEIAFDYVGPDATLRGAALQGLVALGSASGLIPSQSPEGAIRIRPEPTDSLRRKRTLYLNP